MIGSPDDPRRNLMPFTNSIRTIAFDADDTLWVNEPYYNEIEQKFAALLSQHLASEAVLRQLLEAEKRNLRIFGYGAKAFMLSMIETAIELTDGRVSGGEIQQIITMGKEMLSRPIQLLDGVPHVLNSLEEDYTLMVLTKGDLLDQESKIARSGLSRYFHQVEIVSEKTPQSYRKILKRHGLRPDQFVMIGNSLRSDILPVLEIGAYAIHIPAQITWAHEQVAAAEVADKHFMKLDTICQVLDNFETPIRNS
jgi:putative hydrolase of the HAD superfamily